MRPYPQGASSADHLGAGLGSRLLGLSLVRSSSSTGS